MPLPGTQTRSDPGVLGEKETSAGPRPGAPEPAAPLADCPKFKARLPPQGRGLASRTSSAVCSLGLGHAEGSLPPWRVRKGQQRGGVGGWQEGLSPDRESGGPSCLQVRPCLLGTQSVGESGGGEASGGVGAPVEADQPGRGRGAAADGSGGSCQPCCCDVHTQILKTGEHAGRAARDHRALLQALRLASQLSELGGGPRRGGWEGRRGGWPASSAPSLRYCRWAPWPRPPFPL